MQAESSIRVKRIVASRALLAGYDALQAATIDIDPDTGRVSRILLGRDIQAELDPSVLVLEDHHMLLPGLIDCHVHLNQPGRSDWEGFQTGTSAAVSGGVTTVIDMPLNSIPPTTTSENLRTKREEARRIGVRCDVGFWGGIIPGNAAHLPELLEDGVKGFKCFLIHSGVEEFPHVIESDLEKACDALRDTSSQALILFHAELGPHPDELPGLNHSHYDNFLNSRPPTLETTAIGLVIRFAKAYPALRFHIVHLSAAEALPMIRQARSDGVANLTVETCFHYLTINAEDIPLNGTQYKCCPPIRDSGNRQAIREALLDGTIDFAISDHSPCVPELKKGDFMTAWGGVSGLGLGLSLLWSEFRGDADIASIVGWMGVKQARQIGLSHRKGSIQLGGDADFVIFDPQTDFTVTMVYAMSASASSVSQSPKRLYLVIVYVLARLLAHTQDDLHFRNKISPYLGRKLTGRVLETYIRGQCAWRFGQGLNGKPLGQLL